MSNNRIINRNNRIQYRIADFDVADKINGLMNRMKITSYNDLFAIKLQQLLGGYTYEERRTVLILAFILYYEMDDEEAEELEMEPAFKGTEKFFFHFGDGAVISYYPLSNCIHLEKAF